MLTCMLIFIAPCNLTFRPEPDYGICILWLMVAPKRMFACLAS